MQGSIWSQFFLFSVNTVEKANSFLSSCLFLFIEEKVTTAATVVQPSAAKTVLKPAVLAAPQDWQPTFGAGNDSNKMDLDQAPSL